MTKTRKKLLIVLVTVLLGVTLVAGLSILTASDKGAGIDISHGTYAYQDDNGNANTHIRLSQRVTVRNDEGTLPYSGTVTKSHDAFYPGTYKITFNENAILSSKATVEVKVDVQKGETVYILTGNKDNGYSQYAVVTAKDSDCVEFDTNILQNYTISATDICGAQEAMASLVGD